MCRFFEGARSGYYSLSKQKDYPDKDAPNRKGGTDVLSSLKLMGSQFLCQGVETVKTTRSLQQGRFSLSFLMDRFRLSEAA